MTYISLWSPHLLEEVMATLLELLSSLLKLGCSFACFRIAPKDAKDAAVVAMEPWCKTKASIELCDLCTRQ